MNARSLIASAPTLREVIDAKLREAFTRRLLGTATTRPEPKPRAFRREREPFGRAGICDTYGTHDPRSDGTCRDCGITVGDLPVCAPDVQVHAAPDGPTQ